MTFFTNRTRKFAAALVALTLVLSVLLTPAPWADAADHGDAPANANDRQADLADMYLFLDPNDNSKVIIAMTAQGFIVPGEAVNFGIFDHNLRYRFELETTGNAAPDHFIDVTFSEKMTSGATPQTATIVSTFFPGFTAPTTPANLSPNSPNPTITTQNGVAFVAGLFDDPFFFDIPGFARFVASVNAGSPDPTQLQRGRDSFAGYGTMAIVLSIPISFINPILAGTANSQLGLDGRTARRLPRQNIGRPSRLFQNFVFEDRDRAGNPAVNVALIPFPRKNEYNLSNTVEDANGRFANSIIATLTALGTQSAGINALAGVAVARGDFLRVNVGVANTGIGGGNNAPAAFPNGRRLGDDVIDIILTIVANGTPFGDNVNSNDVPFRDQFPFFAPAPQPFAPGTTDDRTRN
jgi:hypothetical protein